VRPKRCPRESNTRPTASKARATVAARVQSHVPTFTNDPRPWRRLPRAETAPIRLCHSACRDSAAPSVGESSAADGSRLFSSPSHPRPHRPPVPGNSVRSLALRAAPRTSPACPAHGSRAARSAYARRSAGRGRLCLTKDTMKEPIPRATARAGAGTTSHRNAPRQPDFARALGVSLGHWQKLQANPEGFAGCQRDTMKQIAKVLGWPVQRGTRGERRTGRARSERLCVAAGHAAEHRRRGSPAADRGAVHAAAPGQPSGPLPRFTPGQSFLFAPVRLDRRTHRQSRPPMRNGCGPQPAPILVPPLLAGGSKPSAARHTGSSPPSAPRERSAAQRPPPRACRP
jgi:hypothetical protein